MKRALLLAVLLLEVAARRPIRELDSGAHVKTIYYNPDAVISLTGAVGWQMMIEFGEDERIENVAIGDSAAWQVTPNKRARMLFVKPLSRKACKPDKAEKVVPLGGRPTPLRLLGCDAGGATFAVAVAAVGEVGVRAAGQDNQTARSTVFVLAARQPQG